MPALRAVASVLFAAAIFVASGCAAATKDSTKDFKGESRAVATTLEDFQDAATKRDEEEICNKLLATVFVQKIEAQVKDGGKGSCPSLLKDSLRDADSKQITVKKVTVSGTTATATVVSEGSRDDRTEAVTLVKEGTPARWKISALAPVS